MLYHNGEKLTKEKFQNPGSEYRAAPFWAWNCRMTKAEIDNTLDAAEGHGNGRRTYTLSYRNGQSVHG